MDGLVPRDLSRGDTFQTVAYFGEPQHLAPELKEPTFQEWMRDQGMELRVISNAADWFDYSAIDAVLAVRDLDGNAHDNKPATKLFNAWLAGVPALLGPESCYAHHRRGELDYIEVRSVADIRDAIVRLKAAPDLRRRMIDNGRARSEQHTIAATTLAWSELIERRLVPDAERWMRNPLQRVLFRARAEAAYLDERRRTLGWAGAFRAARK